MKYMRSVLLSMLSMLLILCTAIPVQAASGPAEGIDVSSFNNTVDWAKVKKQGIKFAMIRTAEGLELPGVDDVDRQFEANYAGAGKVGLKRGAYHVCCHLTVEEAEKEADYCLKILNGRKLEYPVAYDFEGEDKYPRIYATGKENVTNMAKAFCDKIAAAGYTPMIYASSRILNTYFDWDKLQGVKIWVASWDVDKPDFAGTYHIWQYSSTGLVSGAGDASGYCDLDKSYLDAQSVKLNYKKKSLGVKQSFTLKAAVSPVQSWDEATYTSSNKKVATVSSDGTVTAKKKGTATITVKAGSVKATCKVTVKAPTKVTLSKKTVTLKKGKTYTIKPKSSVYCYKYTYKSSKKSVATVSSEGVVTAKKKGTATITVKTYNGKTAKLKVKVK